MLASSDKPIHILLIEKKYGITINKRDGNFSEIENEIAVILDVLNLLPSNIINNNNSGFSYTITFTDGQVKLIENKNGTAITTTLLGNYDRKTGNINLTLDSYCNSHKSIIVACNNFYETLTHEVMHGQDTLLIESDLCGDKNSCARLEAFVAAMENDGVTFNPTGIDGTQPPPNVNNDEDLPDILEYFHYWTDVEAFAEIGAHYLTEPEKLEHTLPETYKFYKEYVYNGTEYQVECLSGLPGCEFNTSTNDYDCEDRSQGNCHYVIVN